MSKGFSITVDITGGTDNCKYTVKTIKRDCMSLYDCLVAYDEYNIAAIALGFNIKLVCIVGLD